MTEREERLLAAVENLLRVNQECSRTIVTECGLPDVTVKQAEYLRVIDQEGAITFTRLACVTGTAKPTVTEMVKRCVGMACVFRERSPNDRRIHYIRLTEKGRAVARADRAAVRRTIERMANSLSDQELDRLSELLGKVR